MRMKLGLWSRQVGLSHTLRHWVCVTRRVLSSNDVAVSAALIGGGMRSIY